MNELDPKDIIKASFINTYEQDINGLWNEIVRLNSNIFILEKLLSFPFDLFQSPPPHFWNLVEDSLFESCVMIIWRVAVDQKSKYLTIQQLKNNIIQNFIEKEHKEQFRKNLRNGNFEATVSDINKKITEIRHNYISHFNYEKNVNPTPEQIEQRTLLFSELKSYRDKLNSFFNLLCFGKEMAALPLDYDPEVINPAGIDSRSDIEQLLDNIAKESSLLRVPEEDPDFWSIYKEKMPKSKLEMFNKYRVKFELPEVQ